MTIALIIAAASLIILLSGVGLLWFWFVRSQD